MDSGKESHSSQDTLFAFLLSDSMFFLFCSMNITTLIRAKNLAKTAKVCGREVL